MTDTPLILWFRRDLRLSDQPMLAAAVATGRPLVALFILDPETEAIGAAPKWRLGLAWATFAKALRDVGLEPVFRRGPALDVLRSVLADTGADAVWWSRLYDPAAVARDTAVKAALKASAVEARSFNGHLLNEPWDVQTGSGGCYRVFTPYWRSVRGREMQAPAPTVRSARSLGERIASERLEDWHLGAAMNRGAAVVQRHQAVGEVAALDRLTAFLAGPVDGYGTMRDRPAVAGTSRLSENLTYGEIGVRGIWHAAMRAMQDGQAGAEGFLREIAWREFA
ncbi:MAG: deoxyribodipyrimidine photo-lyase, partial [Tabrizicola sp.]|nr:deoxyribodipyrimidine photo-lyase [Tabrizicola sp.]